MELDFVFVAERRGNSALGVLRVGFGEFTLGEAENAASSSELDGGAKTGDTRAHDNKVEFGLRLHL